MIRMGLLLLVLAAFSCFAQSDFSGKWSGVENNDDGTQYSSLLLTLHQSGNNLAGSYCYITRNGNRIDCPADNEENLHGIVSDNKAIMVFNSTFGGKNGKATLERQDKRIVWHLTRDPKGGDFYAPETYALDKVIVNPVSFTQCINNAQSVAPAMHDCYQAEIGVQDARLNVSYKTLLASYPADIQKGFIEAQRQWIKFRDANCRALVAGQSGSEQVLITGDKCLLQMTRQRADELDKLLSSTKVKRISP